MRGVTSTDFLIIGGGIIGLSVAREIKKRFSDAKVILLEKEISCGLHASGRNSGIIHAGFYYSANSLKAKLTRAGNLAMTAYCAAKKIPVNKCGKLVVARNESELASLDELLRRGAANGRRPMTARSSGPACKRRKRRAVRAIIGVRRRSSPASSGRRAASIGTPN